MFLNWDMGRENFVFLRLCLSHIFCAKDGKGEEEFFLFSLANSTLVLVKREFKEKKLTTYLFRLARLSLSLFFSTIHFSCYVFLSVSIAFAYTPDEHKTKILLWV